MACDFPEVFQLANYASPLMRIQVKGNVNKFGAINIRNGKPEKVTPLAVPLCANCAAKHFTLLCRAWQWLPWDIAC